MFNERCGFFFFSDLFFLSSLNFCRLFFYITCAVFALCNGFICSLYLFFWNIFFFSFERWNWERKLVVGLGKEGGSKMRAMIGICYLFVNTTTYIHTYRTVNS